MFPGKFIFNMVHEKFVVKIDAWTKIPCLCVGPMTWSRLGLVSITVPRNLWWLGCFCYEQDNKVKINK